MNTDKIVQAIRENGLTLNSLSIKCNVAYATLHDIINGKAKNPRIDTVSKIAKTLKIPINELLIKEEAKYEKSNIENTKKEKDQ